MVGASKMCMVRLWERAAEKRRLEFTLEASLSREFREELIDNGISLASLPSRPNASARTS